MRLIEEYFRTLRAEIHIRIKEHTHLVWVKIVSLGAIIAFLLRYGSAMLISSESSLLYLVWVIPLAAVIFDMLIAGNLRNINNLGHYVRDYIESFDETERNSKERLLFETDGKFAADLDNRVLPQELRKEFKREGCSLCRVPRKKPIVEKRGDDGWAITDEGRKFIVRKGEEEEKLNVYLCLTFGFWEEKAGQAASKYRCYTKKDMFVIWLFTLASGFFSMLLRRETGFKLLDSVLLGAFVIGAVVALWQLIRSITMQRRF